jgi:hypothetical protein
VVPWHEWLQLKGAFERLGHPLSEPEIAAQLARVDKNRDGQLSFSEFSELLLNFVLDSKGAVTVYYCSVTGYADVSMQWHPRAPHLTVIVAFMCVVGSALSPQVTEHEKKLSSRPRIIIGTWHRVHACRRHVARQC